jgi:hypothetical protein
MSNSQEKIVDATVILTIINLIITQGIPALVKVAALFQGSEQNVTVEMIEALYITKDPEDYFKKTEEEGIENGSIAG